MVYAWVVAKSEIQMRLYSVIFRIHAKGLSYSIHFLTADHSLVFCNGWIRCSLNSAAVSSLN